MVRNKQKLNIDGEKMQGDRASQRSRGKYLKKPPEKLAELIEMVNSIPFNMKAGKRLHPLSPIHFMHPETLKSEAEADLYEEGGKDYAFFDLHLGNLVVERLERLNLPTKVFKYVIAGQPGNPSNLLPQEGIFGRYEQLWSANIRLRRIANLVKRTEPMNMVDRYMEYKYSELPYLFRSPVMDVVDEQGYVRVNKDLFDEAMENEDVEAARIRVCPVCDIIFWAGRIDAQQCGAAKCKSVLSSRLNRKLELRELYNKARRTKRRKHGQAKKREQATTKKGK